MIFILWSINMANFIIFLILNKHFGDKQFNYDVFSPIYF